MTLVTLLILLVVMALEVNNLFFIKELLERVGNLEEWQYRKENLGQ